jgi:hypothetical protein
MWESPNRNQTTALNISHFKLNIEINGNCEGPGTIDGDFREKVRSQDCSFFSLLPVSPLKEKPGHFQFFHPVSVSCACLRHIAEQTNSPYLFTYLFIVPRF